MEGRYKAIIRKHLQHHNNFHVHSCFTCFPNAEYSEEFADLPGFDQFTSLSTGNFYWLTNIRVGHLVFRQDNTCYLEPYDPSLFA